MDKNFDWTVLAEKLENGEPQEHKIAQEAEFLWNTSQKLGQKRSSPQLDINAMMAKMKNRIEAEDSVEVIASKRTYLQPRYLKYAASIAIIGMLSFVAYYISSDSQSNLAEEKIEQNISDTSKDLVLSDGTQITLAKGSKLSYPQSFSGNERIVKLEGDAFFDVKRDESKPFSIEMEQAKVKVLGTSFQLSSSKGKAKVGVKSGKVNFANKTGEKFFLLTVGQSAEYNAETNELVKYMGYNYKGEKALIEWQNNRVYFKNVSTRDIVDFIAETQKLEVIWEGNAKESMELSCNISFKTDASITHMLKNAINDKGIKLERDGNKFILK